MVTTNRQTAHTSLATQHYGKASPVLDVPNLIDMPRRSFQRFLDEGLRELFDEISPIEDFTGTRMGLELTDYRLEEPRLSERECRQRDATYSARLLVDTSLTVKETGEIKEQQLFLGDLPLMTGQGTFIINGAERVVVSQLVRSPGVYFTETRDPATGRRLTQAKLIPNRGAWLEFETSAKDLLSVKVDRKRKIPVTILLRAVDMEEGLSDEERGTDERVRAMLADVDTDEEHSFLDATLAKDPSENRQTALEEFYRRIRPGDPPTAENARNLLDTLFFGERRYDLGRVGRYKVNKRLALADQPEQRTLRGADIVELVRKMVEINNGVGRPDDIDHLGNRRVRSVGELIQNQFRIGLLRMERVVRERMTITDPEEATPSALVNVRPVVAAMKEFFGGSQLSQFMDQTNPLAELAHKRRLSALGPGGLSRDRAGFDVRDVHFSHYGRICPIETPEGPNIGLIGNLATYGRVNDFGFIETPYRPVLKDVGKKSPELVGRILAGGRQGRRRRPDRARRPDGHGGAGGEAGGGGRGPHPGASLRLEPDRLPGRPAGGGLPHRAGQHPPRRAVQPLRRAHRGAPRRAAAHGAARRRRLPRRLAEADRLGRGGADPVPRARRREPRADGREHAAPGRAAGAPRGAAGRHRHGRARSPSTRAR